MSWILSPFLSSVIDVWLPNPEEEKASPKLRGEKTISVAPGATEPSMKSVRMCMKGQILARHLYQQEVDRIPELIRRLRNDGVFARETLNAYMAYFNFESMAIDEALRSLLKVFWPEDEVELQHLLIKAFSQHYTACNRLQPDFLPELHNLSWAIIMLNADLHGGHKGKKMTCTEFLMNLTRTSSSRHEYNPIHIINIYKSVKAEQLQAFSVKSRRPDTPFETRDGRAARFRKTGRLVCKRVTGENGRKTRKHRRSWKPFTAFLKDLVLQLQNDIKVGKITIRLHHSVAYPLEHGKRPHVLLLRTADASVYYFQAESEQEQRLWVAAINHIAARYSAPPLTSASSSNEEPRPLVLPTFPSPLSLDQQLKYLKDQLHMVSTHNTVHYAPSQNHKNTPTLDCMKQEAMRYATYVSALETPVKKENPDRHT